MSEWRLDTPVAFIIFNRPDCTQQVLSAIARAKPPKLLVIADGPNFSRPDHGQRCALTRALIDSVDWDCEVLTNYSDANLGCRKRVSSGLDWVFEQVPEAIILEDDCVPDASFFRFCELLLRRYREDERVGMISGDNFQFGAKVTDASYYFSKYTHIWGWASWRRAWQHYDVSAKAWPEFLASGNFSHSTFPFERQTWRNAFKGVYEGRVDTWDYQWTLACWSQSMLSILPQVNLVSNIGFGIDATHTKRHNIYANIPRHSIPWPLKEPQLVVPHYEADRRTAEGMFNISMPRRIAHGVRSLLLRPQ